MPPRRKAADYFTSEGENTSRVVEEIQGGESVQDNRKRSSLRRSTRLHSTPLSGETDTTTTQTTRKNVLQLERAAAARQSPRVEIGAPTTRRAPRSKVNVPTSPSVDDSFVDARELPNSPVQEHSQRTLIKSPSTEDQYVSAVEDISVSLNLAGDSSMLEEAAPRPSHTQNTLENIPSSQPQPRSQRSPVPLQPVSSSPPPASLPVSTPVSQSKSTTASAQLPIRIASSIAENSDDSDDEAPQPISLFQSRSQALASQTKITQQNRLQAEKAREKRRKRDVLLASQKQSKKRPAEAIQEQTEEEESAEIPDSQQSADVESGNTTDTPAPNQAHQAARIARHVDALPAHLLRAARSTWFTDTVGEKRGDAVVQKKKRKVNEDDGIRVLEEMNFGIAPKAGKIGLVKEKMIMQMDKGQRRMFVGRFTR